MTNWNPTVLMYHHVSPDIDYYTNTPPLVFSNHIAWLSQNFQFWTVTEALNAFHQGIPASDRIIITFDDGYIDNIGSLRWSVVPGIARLLIAPTKFLAVQYTHRLDLLELEWLSIKHTPPQRANNK